MPCSNSLLHMLFSHSLIDYMTSLIFTIMVMFYLLFLWNKSYGKLLIFSTCPMYMYWCNKHILCGRSSFIKMFHGNPMRLMPLIPMFIRKYKFIQLLASVYSIALHKLRNFVALILIWNRTVYSSTEDDAGWFRIPIDKVGESLFLSSHSGTTHECNPLNLCMSVVELQCNTSHKKKFSNTVHKTKIFADRLINFNIWKLHEKYK